MVSITYTLLLLLRVRPAHSRWGLPGGIAEKYEKKEIREKSSKIADELKRREKRRRVGVLWNEKRFPRVKSRTGGSLRSGRRRFSLLAYERKVMAETGGDEAGGEMTCL